MPERLLHPWRRRRALARLRRSRRPGSVLFVCHGNICRSPYAAVAFNRLDPDNIASWSAGFVGPGRASPQEAVSAAERRKLDLRAHRSQLLTAGLVEAADVIVVMEVAQARELQRSYGRRHSVLVLGDLDPEPISTRTIADPYNQTEQVFAAVYDRIDRCIDVLMKQFPADRSASESSTNQ